MLSLKTKSLSPFVLLSIHDTDWDKRILNQLSYYSAILPIWNIVGCFLSIYERQNAVLLYSCYLPKLGDKLSHKTCHMIDIFVI